MTSEDHTYYHRRAEAELRQARRAATPGAAVAHQQLADAYRARAASLAAGPPGPDGS